MSVAILLPVNNSLIESLPRQERNRILDFCEPVELRFGAVLCEAGAAYEYVYFPLTGFVSLVTAEADEKPLEMGIIGNEGMLGASLVLGITTAPLRAIVQGSGTALRMRVDELRYALTSNARLSDTLNSYLYVLNAQLSQIAACTHFHQVEARLARRLLMTQDRAHADHFFFTHQLLADMLGVQRSAVTIAAGVLQKRNLIHYRRGEIHILDRKGLEGVSCRCYNAARRVYGRLLG